MSDRSTERTDVAPAAAMLASLAAMVRRQRTAFAACALLVPLLAGVAIRQTTPAFTAQTDVIYDPSSYAVQELQSILRSDPTTDAVMASQIEIVRSLGMAERLIGRFGLDRTPEFNPALRHPSWPKRMASIAIEWLVGFPNPQSERQVVAAAVQRAIEAKPLKTSRVMSITFTSADPFLAADAANAVAEFYIGEQLGLKGEAVRRANDWLESRVASLRQEVTGSEDRIAAYRAESGLVQGVQSSLPTERVSRITADLVQARDDLASADARVSAARQRRTAAAQATVAPSVVALRAQQDQLSAQLQAALTRFGAGHPSVAALRDQLAELRRATDVEANRVLTASASDVAAARERVRALERDEQAARADVSRAAQSQVPLNAMQREAEAARTLLQAVLERAQQTVQQTAIENPDARVISRAVPPARPSSPRPLLLLPAALAMGIGLGLGLAYLLEAGDESFRSGESVRAALALPCLALVPELRPRRRSPVEDHVVETPLSPFSEQIRALRAGLWDGNGPGRVIAITAARPAEGKTTVSAALGRLAALNGERAIVLDCDVRQPSFGRIMKADAALGVTDCLLGHVDAAEIIRTDEATGLDYIPAGSAERNSLALFQSDAMTALLDGLRHRYRLVILDAPPTGAMADARVIARAADATVMCVRWHDTPRQVVEHAIATLREARAELAGIALTRVDMRVHGRAGYADSEVYQSRYGGYFRA